MRIIYKILTKNKPGEFREKIPEKFGFSRNLFRINTYIFEYYREILKLLIFQVILKKSKC